MASAGSIYVDLLLRDANYVAGWNKARRTTSQASSQISGDANKIAQSFNSVINPVDNISAAVRNLTGILAGAFSVQKIVAYSDQWKQLEGRLNIVAGEFGNVAKTQQDLFEIAQRTRQPLDGILSFYSRLAQFIPEAERAQYDLLGVTESVSTALAITGETSASATGAMIQFTQAIGTNFEAAGQELRSLQEQAPRLTQALMKALGDGTKSLQQLKDEGRLTRESVLNALSGMGEEGRRLQEELAKVPLTVGQAFQRLDNAFLKFIGQSSEVNNVTGALALTISYLSENLNIIANALVSVSALFAGRLVASLALSAIGWVKNTQEIIRYNNALRLQAILNGQAIASTSALSVVTSRFVALLGGPVFAAITVAVTALFAYRTNMDAIRTVSVEFLGIGNQIASLNLELANASEKRTKEIIKERDALLAKAQAEIADTQALIKKYQLLQKIGGPLGIGIGFVAGRGESAARERLDAQFKELDKLNADLIDYINNGVPTSSASGGGVSVGNDKDAQKRQSELESIYNKNRELILGLDRATLQYNDTLADLNKLLEANVINDGQFEEAVRRLNESFNENKETVNAWGIDVESFSKKAAENIQDSFADFLFDPFQDGLKGMLKGFVDTVRRMIAEAQAAQLAKALFGASGGGSGSGILGAAFSGLLGLFGGGSGFNPATSAPPPKPQFFADGGYLKPGEFGIAGEAGAELLYGGKTGVSVFNQDQIGGRGNTYNIDARGADQGAVVRLEQALLALAGPGVIEQRVNNAQSRGSL